MQPCDKCCNLAMLLCSLAGCECVYIMSCLLFEDDVKKAEEICERVKTRRSAQNLETEITQIVRRIKAEEKKSGFCRNGFQAFVAQLVKYMIVLVTYPVSTIFRRSQRSKSKTSRDYFGDILCGHDV